MGGMPYCGSTHQPWVTPQKDASWSGGKRARARKHDDDGPPETK